MDNYYSAKVSGNRICYLLVLISAISFSGCKVNSASGSQKSQGIRVLLVGGGSSHDFNRWYRQADVETLQRDGFATVSYTSNPDSILYFLPNVDVLYTVTNQPINSPEVRQAIMNHVNSGKGLVVGHAGLWYNWKDWPEYNLQLVSGGSRGHNRYGEFDVNLVNANHPVTKGVETKFTLKDELYYYIPDPAGMGVEVLANSSAAGSDKIYPSVFVIKHPKAKIVGIALGHDAESHNIQPYQTLLRNAVRWVADK